MNTSKTAVVTGAGQGIGKAIALRLAHDGFRIVVSDINEASANEVCREIRDGGGSAIPVAANVGNREDVFRLAKESTAVFGSLDVYVSNAGIAQVKPLLEVTEEELERIFRINVFGTIYGIQAAAEQMKPQGSGKIINAASIAAHKGMSLLSVYSATKFAVRGITQAASQELAQFGITVNAYCPGIVMTPMWDLIDEKMAEYMHLQRGEALQKYTESITLGRTQQPEDVAAFVSYLASADSGYMTGQSVLIDGGILFQ